jgi:hypothetical protein
MESIGMFRPFSTMPHAHKALVDDAYFMPHWRNEINKDKVLGNTCASTDGAPKITAVAGCPKDEKQYMTNNVDFFQHEQVPPIFCKERHLPINITTLSPFLQKGRSLLPSSPGWSNGGICLSKSPDTSKGHDIEYIARDGVYPTHLSVRHPYDNYSQNHWYRAIALRGPLVMAGWGFDIDNKPVPNESTSYPNNPKMKFEQDWLRKPQKWMCGPIDLRWDYKRNVWTAPSPMKIVKLELNEHLCPDQCANAILYNDQEQYDYDGDPLECEGVCSKKGYKVKVYSNAMYPVPKGWRIMAYFDTTLNRYQMINHDPLPIVEVDLDATMLCVDGEGTIVGPAGSCDGALDPCGALTGMTIKLQNTLNQPLCAPRKVFAWICGFECSVEGEAGPTLGDCEVKCMQPLKAKGIILQAEFKPECVVTHLELLEFYAWGYDVSCDEEDVTIYPQGDVETCWDWCLKLEGIACASGVSGTTDEDTHSHTMAGASFSGTISGVTGSAAHTHTGTTAVASSGAHTHSGTTSVGASGAHDHGVTAINTDVQGSHTHSGSFVVSTVANHSHNVQGDTYGGGYHDHGSTSTSDSAGGHTPTTASVSITASGAHSHTLAAGSTNNSGAHTHDGVYNTYELTIYSSGSHVHALSGTTDVVGSHAHPGTVTMNAVPSHTHEVPINSEASHVHYIDLGTTENGTHNHSGIVTMDSKGAHNHGLTGVTDNQVAHTHPGTIDVASSGAHTHSGTVSIDTNYHSHPLDIAFSGTLSGGTTGGDAHDHGFTVPSHEVKLCLESDFDLDIDSRFVPSPCVVRISVVNKNFWEYYWYALCICTRAIWHEAEFGPAVCNNNTTPDCDTDCEDIDCANPVYNCAAPARTQYALAAGEEVSWFGMAVDTTLLNTETTCNDYDGEACTVAASCAGSLTLPTLEECLAGSGCAVDDSGNGTATAQEWDSGVAGLGNYCPDPNAGNFIEAAFMRDFNAGLFDFIEDDAGEHIPPGVPPF